MTRERPSVSARAGRLRAATPAPSPTPRTGEVPPDEERGPTPNTLVVANPALRGGFVQLPVAVLQTPGLSRDAKLLYAILLRYAWQAGSCFPGYETLQADMDCSPNSLTKYMSELDRVGLISRQRRYLGQTTIYTLHELPKKALPGKSRKNCDTSPPKTATPASQKLRHESDSEESDSEEQHHGASQLRDPAPPSGADADDALVASLEERGITPRVARQLATTHDAKAVREQLDWLPYRPQAKNPAGALVDAIRGAWPPPPAWLEAQEHAATVARQAEAEVQRQAEEEAHRRAWAQKPPEERIAGRLAFWIQGRRVKGREPTDAEIAAQRARLLAELASAPPTAPG
jgi:hypothetical protein